MSKLMMTQKPLVTAEAAVYPYSDAIKKRFSAMSRFDDPIALYREIGKGKQKRILVPRGACPLGEDKRVVGTPVEFESSFVARNPEQSRVVMESIKLLLSGESFLVQAPTGFGKTVCTMPVIAEVGRKTMIVVTKEDVRDQWIAAAKMVLGLTMKDIGLVQGKTCSVVGKKFVIGMIQSLSKKDRYPPGTFKDFGLVIWDEVHRVGADTFANSSWLFPALLRLGLSATPDRKDGKEIVFKTHIGSVRVKTESMPMIPKVLIKRSEFKLPIVPRKINGVWKHVSLPHSPGKTMHISKLLAKDMVRNKVIAQFVKQARTKGRSIIIFADTKDHLERLYDVCLMAGVARSDLAFYIGGMKKDDRERAKVKPVILSTYSFTSEATDIPWLDTMVMATPRSDVVQIVGRVLREYPDKKQPIVFDIVDNDSKVYQGYYSKRMKWYRKIKAEIKHV